VEEGEAWWGLADDELCAAERGTGRRFFGEAKQLRDAGEINFLGPPIQWVLRCPPLILLFWGGELLETA
jgi:hypothetical protein